MSSPGATELLIVLVIVLLILGPKRLPSLGRQLGGGIREFRKSIGGSDDAADTRDAQHAARRDDGHATDSAPPAAEADPERRSV